MPNKRYFINNYIKSKFSSTKIFGEPKCIFCGCNTILDLHHIYTYKKYYLNKKSSIYDWMKKRYYSDEKGGFNYKEDKVDKIIFVCPNHHYVYHRLINSYWDDTSDYYKKNQYKILLCDLKLIKKRINELEKNRRPYYSKGKIKKGIIGNWVWKDRLYKRYGKEGERLYNKKGEVVVFETSSMRYSYAELKKQFDDDYLKETPKCLICGYIILLDANHIHKEERVYFFCPTHHCMVHRNLNDTKGDKLTLREIKKCIKEIEINKKPYYNEVSRGEYLKYKGYNIMKIKE